MVKAIRVDLPYPDINDITKDYESAKIISKAYASNHGELSAILQYVYHHYYFENNGDKEIAETLIGISVTEMEHFELLGKLMLKLGVDPVYTVHPPCRFDCFNTSGIIYSKQFQKMILDDISGEMLAIDCYEQMLKKLDNESVEMVISRILLDEELHVKVLKNILEKTCSK